MQFKDLLEAARKRALIIGLAVAGFAILVGLVYLFRSQPSLVIGPCINDPAQLPPPSLATDGQSDSQEADYLHTCGGSLYDANGRAVRITGINWFGMETGTYTPHGLWSRSYKSILDQIVYLGYNTIRLPFSNEALEPGRQPQGINYQLNPDLEGLSSIEVMDKIVVAAGERGLKIILDRHRPTAQEQTPLWYTDDVSEERWIADWQMLAQRYLGDDTVIAVDLHNEPKGEATWGSGDLATDWRLAAERGGNAVLAVNPYLLVFVQGVDHMGDDYYWWGGNLQGVANNPVRLSVPNRVVYSPHDYGPEVFLQGWFLDPSFPANLPAVWDKNWGYIQKKGIAPVVLGEFGGRSVGSDAEGLWQQALLNYLDRNHFGFVGWTLNPNSSDTGGLLSDDWVSVVAEKQDFYRKYLAPLMGRAKIASQAQGTNTLSVTYHPGAIEDQTNTINIHMQIINGTNAPIAYQRIEVRYWFSSGMLYGRSQQFDVDFAPMGETNVNANFVSISRGDQDHYLSISFDDMAGNLPAYSSSGEMIMRVHKSDWSLYDQSNDFSYSPFTDFTEWRHITVYLDNKLVWGDEP